MAEGDTILRLARRLDERLAGRPVSVRTPGARRPDGLPATELDGRVLERVESRGKHLLLHFDGGLGLHSHLGMRGRWQIYAQGEQWRRPARDAWIAVAGSGAEAVNFGGSRMRIAREAQLRLDPKLARLGPDLLADDFDPAVAATRISARPELELGEALLGQRLVAGIGNIFRSEGCFAAGVNPHTASQSRAKLARKGRPHRMAANPVTCGEKTGQRASAMKPIWIPARGRRNGLGGRTWTGLPERLRSQMPARNRYLALPTSRYHTGTRAYWNSKMPAKSTPNPSRKRSSFCPR